MAAVLDRGWVGVLSVAAEGIEASRVRVPDRAWAEYLIAQVRAIESHLEVTSQPWSR